MSDREFHDDDDDLANDEMNNDLDLSLGDDSDFGDIDLADSGLEEGYDELDGYAIEADGFDASDDMSDGVDAALDDELNDDFSEVLDDGIEQALEEALDDTPDAAGTAKTEVRAANGSFLSTTTGKAVVGGVSAFAILMIGINGYSMFVGSSPAPAQDMAADWGQPVNEMPLAAEQVAANVPDEPITPEPTTSLPIATQPAIVAADVTTPAPVSPTAVVSVINRINADRQSFDAEGVFGVPQVEPEPVAAAAPVQAPVATVDLEGLRADIIAAIRQELPEQPTADQAPSPHEAELVAAIESLQQQVASMQNEMAADGADTNAQSDGDLREGRTRIKGFHVIKVTDDGTMSVVETPSGRVNVYFKGEVFNAGGQRVKVTGIAEEGRLVLVEDDMFIDETREHRPAHAAITPTPQPASTPAPAPALPPEVTAAPTPAIDQVSVVTPSGNVVLSPKPAPGWDLNASMTQGYLVKNPRGEFELVRQGDLIEGLGIVDGLDYEGNLRVGIYKIGRE